MSPIGQATANDTRLRQVVDGFSYNTMLLWQYGRFFPNALAQLDVLRRAVNYRTRWWVMVGPAASS